MNRADIRRANKRPE